MTADYAEDLALALELADLADAVSLARFRAVDLDVQTKPDRTPVTEADLAVERAIRDRLAEARPGDGILGEEFGTEGDSTRQWILDPIDGTANFLRGVPVWGTLIALAVDGVPVVGVASSPAMGRRWWAARGHGAWTTASAGELGVERPRLRMRHPLAYRAPGACASRASSGSRMPRSASRASPSGATRATSTGCSRCRSRCGATAPTATSGRTRCSPRALIDITGEFDVKPYDLAALVPIVEEAGGRFTSIAGEPGPWHGSALATNGRLHDVVLAALAGDGAEA